MIKLVIKLSKISLQYLQYATTVHLPTALSTMPMSKQAHTQTNTSELWQVVRGRRLGGKGATFVG